VEQADAGQALEGADGEVIVGADAGAAVADALGPRLGGSDEVGEAPVGAVGQDIEGARVVDDVGDGG
jgi:hypothetical protein